MTNEGNNKGRTTVVTLALLTGIVGLAGLVRWKKDDLNGAAAERSLHLSEGNGDSSDSISDRVSSLESALSISSEGVSSVSSSSEKNKLDVLADEIEELEEAQALTEERLGDIEEDAAALAKVSGFEIAFYKPANGYKLPNQVIEFRGRTTYTLEFKIKQLGYVRAYGNILLVGDTSASFRSPGVWIYPYSRRLHIRQRGEKNDGDHSFLNVYNKGCDPSGYYTPLMGTQYAVKVIADHTSFRVYYNARWVCVAYIDVLPPPGQQTVWIGRPGAPANAEISDLKFKID